MIFTVKDLVLFEIVGCTSIAIIEVVTTYLIHIRRLEDNKWFMFHSATYDLVKKNFGQMTIEELEIKYPEALI